MYMYVCMYHIKREREREEGRVLHCERPLSNTREADWEEANLGRGSGRGTGREGEGGGLVPCNSEWHFYVSINEYI